SWASGVPGRHGASISVSECAKQCSRTSPRGVASTSSGDAGWLTTLSIAAPMLWRNGRPSESRHTRISLLSGCVAQRRPWAGPMRAGGGPEEAGGRRRGELQAKERAPGSRAPRLELAQEAEQHLVALEPDRELDRPAGVERLRRQRTARDTHDRDRLAVKRD